MIAQMAIRFPQQRLSESDSTARLIAEVCAGSREALRTLFLCYKDRVYATALGCLPGDAAGAEDVVQEVFVKLAERIGQFRGEAAFTTYLHQITVNTCLNERRRRKRLTSLSECLPDEAEATSESAIESQDLHAALAALPEALRTPLLLRYFEGLSYDEIAQELHCAPGTVASRLHRGIEALGKRLGAGT